MQVLDLSCRKTSVRTESLACNETDYVVVTDRWQKFTTFRISEDNLKLLAQYCDEFLVHGVDVEGKQCGIEVLSKLFGHLLLI